MLLTQRDFAKQLGIAPQIVAASTKSGTLNHVMLPGDRKPLSGRRCLSATPISSTGF